jgi:hypothetical protein
VHRIVEARRCVEDCAGGSGRVGRLELAPRDPVGDDPGQLTDESVDMRPDHLARVRGELNVRCEELGLVERLALRADQEVEPAHEALEGRTVLECGGLEG